jgi:hypothetical protein
VSHVAPHSPPAFAAGDQYVVPSGLVYDNASISPAVARWTWQPPTSDTLPPVVNAFHSGYWGGWSFQVAHVEPGSSSIAFGPGGWQEARGSSTGGGWNVENVMEELDAPGEWFLDAKNGK